MFQLSIETRLLGFCPLDLWPVDSKTITKLLEFICFPFVSHCALLESFVSTEGILRNVIICFCTIITPETCAKVKELQKCYLLDTTLSFSFGKNLGGKNLKVIEGLSIFVY